MCCNTFRIKPVNPTASTRIYCQCGICEDCRKAEREHWSFRLQAELLGRQKQGWKAGFFTLTYNDAHLPQYYLACVDDDGVVRDDLDPWDGQGFECFPCFSRSDVREFILRLRKYLWKHYAIKGISYMICSEYGDDTRRPHYHGIISWPCVPDLKNEHVLTAEKMHELICNFWCDKGFVIPKDALGGYDSKGRHHNPFEVDCLVHAAKYCAKYVCKDLGFWHDAIEYGIDPKDRRFRKEYAPFHIQNRGLGQQFLAELTEKEKVDLLLNGFAFVGSDVFLRCPIYLRNKLLFDTHYVYDIHTHNRLVRRDANQFFEKYKSEIYRHKVDTFTEMFSRLQSPDYTWNRVSEFFESAYGHIENSSSTWSDFSFELEHLLLTARQTNPRDLASYFFSYYHVPLKYRLADPVESWFNHFTQFYKDSPEPFEVCNLDSLISLCFFVISYIHNPRDPDQNLIDFVSDYHKSME